MKKTEFITFRTDSQVKDALSRLAEERKWSISQLSEQIIRQFLENRQTDPNKDNEAGA